MAYHSLQIWIGRDFRAILAKHVSQIKTGTTLMVLRDTFVPVIPTNRALPCPGDSSTYAESLTHLSRGERMFDCLT